MKKVTNLKEFKNHLTVCNKSKKVSLYKNERKNTLLSYVDTLNDIMFI